MDPFADPNFRLKIKCREWHKLYRVYSTTSVREPGFQRTAAMLAWHLGHCQTCQKRPGWDDNMGVYKHIAGQQQKKTKKKLYHTGQPLTASPLYKPHSYKTHSSYDTL